MQKQQVQLVQESFAQIAPIAPAAAELFYGRLFELDPSLRPLFRTPIEVQGEKLMKMLALAVSKLEEPDILIPALKDLGARHVAYGVRDEHYATVGQALMWTLQQGLGEDFRDELQTAWSEAYALMSDTMIAAAQAAGTTASA